nr:GPN-loop GTPase 3-like [Ipomoea trifida]
MGFTPYRGSNLVKRGFAEFFGTLLDVVLRCFHCIDNSYGPTKCAKSVVCGWCLGCIICVGCRGWYLSDIQLPQNFNSGLIRTFGEAFKGKENRQELISSNVASSGYVNLCALVIDITEFTSDCIPSLSAMVQLERPHINILSKLDLVTSKKDINIYFNSKPHLLINQYMALQFQKLNTCFMELVSMKAVKLYFHSRVWKNSNLVNRDFVLVPANIKNDTTNNNKNRKHQYDPTYVHVCCNMSSIDVLAVNLSIKVLGILAESSKPLVTVRNIKPTIQSTLKPRIK